MFAFIHPGDKDDFAQAVSLSVGISVSPRNANMASCQKLVHGVFRASLLTKRWCIIVSTLCFETQKLLFCALFLFRLFIGVMLV